jgi:hypothetical protein
MVADLVTARKIFLTKWTLCLTNWSLAVAICSWVNFTHYSRFSQKCSEGQNGFEINLCIVSR